MVAIPPRTLTLRASPLAGGRSPAPQGEARAPNCLTTSSWRARRGCDVDASGSWRGRGGQKELVRGGLSSSGRAVAHHVKGCGIDTRIPRN